MVIRQKGEKKSLNSMLTCAPIFQKETKDRWGGEMGNLFGEAISSRNSVGKKTVNTRSQAKTEEYPREDKKTKEGKKKDELKDIREGDMTKQFHTDKMRHGKFFQGYVKNRKKW